MPPTPPCEYVDVALYFQQMARERDAGADTPASVSIGEPCGEPSVITTEGEAPGNYCDIHARQPNLVRD